MGARFNKGIIRFDVEIDANASKSDGTARKLLDSTGTKALALVPTTSLKAEFGMVYNGYQETRLVGAPTISVRL